MAKEEKLEFPVRLLERQLQQEKRDLNMWLSIVEKSVDPIEIKQAQGNIPSTRKRIQHLEKALEGVKEMRIVIEENGG